MKLWSMLLVQLVVIVTAGYGWVMNIIAIVNAFQVGSNVDAMLVLRCIGIPLVPLGVVLGYI